MPFVTTSDDCEIYYEVHGDGNATSPLIVLISGYMGIAEIWTPLIKELSSDYRYVVHDNRGYGRSSKPEDPAAYSISRHAQDLQELLEGLQLTSPALLVTHSMGSFIAAEYYLSSQQNRDRVTNIVFTAAGLNNTEDDSRIIVEKISGDANVPSKCVEFYTNFGLCEEIAIEAAKWPSYARKNNAIALAEYQRKDWWKQIDVPVNVVHGDGDVITDLEEACRPLAAGLPNSKLHVLKGVNHFPPTEAPELLAALIRDL